MIMPISRKSPTGGNVHGAMRLKKDGLDPERLEQIKRLCELGATDPEIAYFFGISLRTFTTWRATHPALMEALAIGKAAADTRVERSLFARAIGCELPAVKIFYDHRTGEVIEHNYIERYVPDVTACIFWLKNRKPDVWRERYDLPQTSPEEAALIAQEAMRKAMATS
jgi:hypothetical protein